MRLLHDSGVFFLEFRPEVSEGGSHEPEDDIGNSKQRLGRAVLSARVTPTCSRMSSSTSVFVIIRAHLSARPWKVMCSKMCGLFRACQCS